MTKHVGVFSQNPKFIVEVSFIQDQWIELEVPEFKVVNA